MGDFDDNIVSTNSTSRAEAENCASSVVSIVAVYRTAWNDEVITSVDKREGVAVENSRGFDCG